MLRRAGDAAGLEAELLEAGEASELLPAGEEPLEDDAAGLEAELLEAGEASELLAAGEEPLEDELAGPELVFSLLEESASEFMKINSTAAAVTPEKMKMLGLRVRGEHTMPLHKHSAIMPRSDECAGTTKVKDAPTHHINIDLQHLLCHFSMLPGDQHHQ
jgi:hypothetical protein